MGYDPGSSYYKEFATANPTTGAAQNADSLPTATANHNGTDDGSFTLTVTNVATGRYKITGTVPSGYAAGDVVNVSVAATVSSVAGVAIVDTQILNVKTGIVLAAAGLDQVSVETVNARQALDLILDAVASLLSGATGSAATITIKDPTGVHTRISATVDANGNRTAITLTPPS